MNKTLYIPIIALSLMFFQGCGGNGSGGGTVDMVKDQPYSVSSTNKITPTSDNTQIEVVHTLSDGTKVVKLISGTAKLTR